ncbi:type IV secretory pathway TraG/TraD family ATPase VirD4 [Chitinophaga terrae (ex Kim and Jung 2007)]|uniref:type IV secretory system conjugative DNA transfer family protein n=1 Tax=Chitinophaga terrae (ex Kim and Jung 2007) TaxID=408074 RepID=UPI00278B8515|nr:type IV secretory system conjugative DNA transfer family protein [Chitinophaga terrae (ex Kim and Jung 2007)]MDQ0107451.1 type IV secretory pathway TraG/TraD family ATPase VirD4 [Chitinophaga terrae (ex Kim and Jung 2007)]
MFLYDFKMPELSVIAYNTLRKNLHAYKKPPKFYSIYFDDLNKSNRCNPLDPDSLKDISDASEASRTILLGLNKEWLRRQGDFFVESSINFLTAILWFLKSYDHGRFCTLPHAIELMQAPYDELFSVLQTVEEAQILVNPFLNAYLNNAASQLEGQIASAKIGMARLSSPQLYWVMSGNDFGLDINNPDDPKIVCMGNSPQKQQIYGAVLSLYISRAVKIANQRGKEKSSFIFDEFATIVFSGMDHVIGTARSNRLAVTLSVNDYSQLKRDYGNEQAEVILNTVGNIISGQVTGDSAKQLSERFGRIMQARQSKSINSNDISISHSNQLESAIPASRISQLSSGEFVGIVADNPDQRIEQKMFHGEIVTDFDKIKREELEYDALPIVGETTQQEVHKNYLNIKRQARGIIEDVLEDVRNDPAKAHLLIVKE